jgi:anti-sigma factor RsiW
MSLLSRDLVCRQAVALMTDYLEGRLSRRDAKRLAKHLAACDGCTGYLADLKVTIDAVGRTDVDSISDEAVDALTEVYRAFLRDQAGGSDPGASPATDA